MTRVPNTQIGIVVATDGEPIGPGADASGHDRSHAAMAALMADKLAARETAK